MRLVAVSANKAWETHDNPIKTSAHTDICPFVLRRSVAKTGKNMDDAGIDFLYKLYMSDVIPVKPYVKPEGVELAIQMATALLPVKSQFSCKSVRR